MEQEKVASQNEKKIYAHKFSAIRIVFLKIHNLNLFDSRESKRER